LDAEDVADEAGAGAGFELSAGLELSLDFAPSPELAFSVAELSTPAPLLSELAPSEPLLDSPPAEPSPEAAGFAEA